MIDELIKVAKALEEAGTPTYKWHPALSSLPSASSKKPCIRIWLLPDGHIKGVERLPDSLDKQLWKYEPNNGFALPGFNYSQPNLEKIFCVILESLEKRCSEHLVDNETLSLLLATVRLIDPARFDAEFKAHLQAAFDQTLADELLKGKPSVFLDICAYNEYPVASEKTMQRLNELLWLSDTPVPITSSDVYKPDAHAVEDLYPQVTLPILGGVKLRSQVTTIPTQIRYDHSESTTFPTGVDTRKRVKAALEWLAPRTGERAGETYGKAGDKELLFAYPRFLPKSKIPLAKVFGVQIDAHQAEERFENLAKSVIEQLKGTGSITEDALLEIFSLRKVDKARTKVVYYRNTTVVALETCSINWSKGCQNIPPLSISNQSKAKGQKKDAPCAALVEPATVYPLKLYRFLNTAWARDRDKLRSSDKKVSIFKPTDGLRLLLDDPCSELASFMLERFMQHAQAYFLALCRSAGKREPVELADKAYYPGVLGLLLFKLGKRKDEYMKESAFLLGRCLRVADELHRLYCVVVRKGQLPPELCGSSLLVGMMESPGMALSQLAMRSAPYAKWARGGSDKADKGGLVWYWLRQWEEINDQLHALEWPTRMTPDARAQVFLGFLSSFSKKEDLGGVEMVDENKEGELK